MTSRRDLITDYFRRQYETKEGSTEDNVNGLFDEELVFHLTGDNVMGREALTTLCDLLRRMRHGQSTLVTRFEEEGDEVSFVLYILGSDPITGHEVSVSTRTRYRFSGDQVVEVWQENPAALEAAVRAGGSPAVTREGSSEVTETQDPTAVVVAEHAEAEPGVEKPAFNLLVWMSERGIFIFTTVLVIVAAVFIDGFASLANITDVFNRAAPIGIVAVGMTFRRDQRQLPRPVGCCAGCHRRGGVDRGEQRIEHPCSDRRRVS